MSEDLQVDDELRKTVPCTRSRDGESSVSDRSSSRCRNHQGGRGCRPETTARFFMKLFRTSNIDIVNYCRAEFNFELPGTVIEQRTSQFRDKYRACDYLYCKLLCVRWWSVHCIIIVINCRLRNNLVKLVKFKFCLFLLPFWWIKLNIYYVYVDLTMLSDSAEQCENV